MGGRGVTQLTFEVVVAMVVTNDYTLGRREKSEKKDKGGEMHHVGKVKGGGEGVVRNGR